jgi:hypothetical protein
VRQHDEFRIRKNGSRDLYAMRYANFSMYFHMLARSGVTPDSMRILRRGTHACVRAVTQGSSIHERR